MRAPRGDDPRQRIGRAGESAAAEALVRAGLSILERRYRCCGAEIDLIAADAEGRLVFVEVKTRSGTGFGVPAEAVTPTKRDRLARAALGYLSRHGCIDRPSRFDVVEVLVAGPRILEIRHHVDAFRPDAAVERRGSRRYRGGRRG